jgi:hypothetical protein
LPALEDLETQMLWWTVTWGGNEIYLVTWFAADDREITRREVWG